jgi:hypothetical protein
MHPIWEAERLNIRLSSSPVDLGKKYSLRLAGEDVIQSFDTQLLHRAYDFPVELTVEVGGQSFQILEPNYRLNVLSPTIARSGHMLQTQPCHDYWAPTLKEHPNTRLESGPIKIQLQGSYIGRLVHNGASLDRSASEHGMIEAAIALSRTFTEAGIEHSFPGGTLIKLLPYSPNEEDDKPSWGSETDKEKLHRLFGAHGSKFRVLEGDHPFEPTMSLGFMVRKHREKITVEFPGQPPSKSFQLKPLTAPQMLRL